MKEVTSLFNRWLAGNLTNEERHELEKKSLDDGMLYDAMEGIELYQQTDRDKIATRLNSQLKTHQAERKSIVRTLWPYAAAASLALVAGAYFINTQNEPINDSVIALEILEDESSHAEPSSGMATAEIYSDKEEDSIEEEDIIIARRDLQQLIAKSQPQTASEPKAEKINFGKKENESEEASPDKSNLSGSLATVSSDDAIEGEDEPAIVGTTMQKSQSSKSTISSDASSRQSTYAMRKNEMSTSIDSTTPVIGYAKMVEILRASPFERSYFFLRGIDVKETAIISFDTDSDGMPTNLDSGILPVKELKELLQKIGPWPSHNQRVEYQLPVFLK